MKLYPYSDDKTKQKSYISYQKCLSTLTSKFKYQEFVKLLEKEQFRFARLTEHKELWESLKTRPISKQILEPTAMPVEIAKEETLDDFFNFLKLNLPLSEETITRFNSFWYPGLSCLQFERGAFYPDGRMDLCKQVVGPLWINKLVDSIRDNEHIKHFLLGNNIMGTVGCLAIKNFLLNPHKPHIHTWYIAGNDINSEGIGYIVDGLENDNDVKELWLKRNPIKSDGMKHIQRLLENNKSIEVLDLHNTAILDEGMKYICDGLKKNTTLKKLYIDANGIGKNGIVHLTEYFQYLVDNDIIGVTSIWVDMNRIGDEGIISFVNCVGKYKYLERLNIGSNMLSHVSMESVYNAFKDHTKLRVLDIGMYKSTADMGEITNRMGNEGAYYIGKLISENKSIEYLSITNNDINNTGMQYIINGLKYNNTLLLLDYKQYYTGIKQEYVSYIKDKLIDNRHNKGIVDIHNYSRELKHTTDIYNIDSIYRNNENATPTSTNMVGRFCTLKKKIQPSYLVH